jgi:hypothetical protein
VDILISLDRMLHFGLLLPVSDLSLQLESLLEGLGFYGLLVPVQFDGDQLTKRIICHRHWLVDILICLGL